MSVRYINTVLLSGYFPREVPSSSCIECEHLAVQVHVIAATASRFVKRQYFTQKFILPSAARSTVNFTVFKTVLKLRRLRGMHHEACDSFCNARRRANKEL